MNRNGFNNYVTITGSAQSLCKCLRLRYQCHRGLFMGDVVPVTDYNLSIIMFILLECILAANTCICLRRKYYPRVKGGNLPFTHFFFIMANVVHKTVLLVSLCLADSLTTTASTIWSICRVTVLTICGVALLIHKDGRHTTAAISAVHRLQSDGSLHGVVS